MQPKHQKQTEYTKQPDGSVKIEQKSYYEKLSQVVVEIEKPMATSSYTLKQDIEHTLEHILKEGSPKLTLTIETKHGEPTRIIKRYITVKERYPRLWKYVIM